MGTQKDSQGSSQENSTKHGKCKPGKPVGKLKGIVIPPESLLSKIQGQNAHQSEPKVGTNSCVNLRGPLNIPGKRSPFPDGYPQCFNKDCICRTAASTSYVFDETWLRQQKLHIDTENINFDMAQPEAPIIPQPSPSLTEQEARLRFYDSILLALRSTFQKKNSDYGSATQEGYRQLSTLYFAAQVFNKSQRLMNLSKKMMVLAEIEKIDKFPQLQEQLLKEFSPNFESVFDMLLDCANYCILGALELVLEQGPEIDKQGNLQEAVRILMQSHFDDLIGKVSSHQEGHDGHAGDHEGTHEYHEEKTKYDLSLVIDDYIKDYVTNAEKRKQIYEHLGKAYEKLRNGEAVTLPTGIVVQTLGKNGIAMSNFRHHNEVFAAVGSAMFHSLETHNDIEKNGPEKLWDE